MPRIRTVKPEFWSDEKLAPLDPVDRLVFLGLISMADDAGRLLALVKVIDAFVFPYTAHSARESLANLSRMGRIQVGRASSGQLVVQIANWEAHQRVDHPNLLAALPVIETQLDGVAHFSDDAGAVRESLANDSRAIPDSIYDLRSTTNDQRPVPARKKRALATPDGKGDTWLTPYIGAWKQSAGEPAVKELAARMKPIEAEVGPARALAALTRWLEAGNAKFGAANFARSWREWDDDPDKVIETYLPNGEINPVVRAAFEQGARVRAGR